MHQTVSGAVAASFAEATPDSLGSHNYHCRAAAAAAAEFGMATAAEGHADREGYSRRGSPTTGCMAAQNTVGSVAVVTLKMTRTGCHQRCNHHQCGLAGGEVVARRHRSE